MTVHITNIYGIWSKKNSTAKVAQHMVAKIACQELGMNELGQFHYEWDDEPTDVLNGRFDGIIASLSAGDTVIIQSPSWHGPDWDNAFIDHLNAYPDIKKIIFIHDIPPLMADDDSYLPVYIDYYNKADLLIVASEKMYQFLRQNGLEEKPYVVQHFWDHPVDNLEYSITPQNNKVINFAGNFDKFKFLKTWNHPDINIQVFSDPKQSYPEQNLEVTGWTPDAVLVDTLRRNGGFGLLWDENSSWAEYIKINASYKTSTYLAAGIPIIVKSDMPEKDTIERKNIGIVADSLEEVNEKVSQISDDEYNQMVRNVDSFAKLIRHGYFTKKALTEAVFKVRYE